MLMQYADDNEPASLLQKIDAVREAAQQGPPKLAMVLGELQGTRFHAPKQGIDLIDELIAEPKALAFVPGLGVFQVRPCLGAKNDDHGLRLAAGLRRRVRTSAQCST